MSEGSGTAYSGPVSNAGPMSANLTPSLTAGVPATGVTSQLLQPVPLLSIPSHPNGHISTAQSIQGGTTSGGPPSNLQPKIPPLMGIRTDTLPPPPPVKLPAPAVPPGGSTGEKSAGAKESPKGSELPPPQKKAHGGGDEDEDSDGEGEGGKGERGPLSQEDLV